MLSRYQELCYLDAIDELTPNAHKNRDINTLLVRLNDLLSVTKTLQCDIISLADVRSLFDAVVDSYPDTCARLAEDAAIVLDPVFESAALKVLEGQFGYISAD